jgi:hypothetical protein
MTRRRPARKRLLALLLVLACLPGAGLLALHRDDPDLLVLRLAGGKEVQSPAQTTANGIEPNTTQPNLPPPESRFAVIALRPLFAPNRRPPEQPVTPAPVSKPNELPAVILTGIVRAGDDSLVIVEAVRAGGQSEPALTLRVGDSLGGWVVKSIGVDRVVLTQGDELRELELKEDASRRRPLPPRNDRKKTSPRENLQPPRVVQPAQPQRTE